MSSLPVFSGVRVTRSLALWVCFVDRCLSFYTFSFGHCVVCPSIYRFWLPLWYLQTLLITSYFSQHSVLLAKMHILKIWPFLVITGIEILFNVCIYYNIIIIVFKVLQRYPIGHCHTIYSGGGTSWFILGYIQVSIIQIVLHWSKTLYFNVQNIVINLKPKGKEI